MAKKNLPKKSLAAADGIMQILKQKNVTYNEGIKALNYVKFLIGERRPAL